MPASPLCLRPTSVRAAVAALRADPQARPLSGGATLVAMMNARLVAPSRVVALESIAELLGIHAEPAGGVRIGAMVRHRDTAAEPLLSGTLAVVRAAAGSVANPVVRNMGTIGGSIAFADPAADYPPALVAADAVVEVAGPGDRRLVPARAFFVDWYRTALEPAELVVAVHLPPARPGIGTYRKVARVAGDFAVASIALVVAAGPPPVVRVAIGGCGPAPLFSDEANALLGSRCTDDAAIARAAAILVASADPVDDARGSAEYRRRLIPRLLRTSIVEARRSMGATR
jgi:carbon-monoxide dehydrogenase medium subunit